MQRNLYVYSFPAHLNSFPVIRCILIHDNKKLARSDLGQLNAADRERIEEFARLEGIALEEALERKRGFRYLY